MVAASGLRRPEIAKASTRQRRPGTARISSSGATPECPKRDFRKNTRRFLATPTEKTQARSQNKKRNRTQLGRNWPEQAWKARLVNHRKDGGGGRTRTYDLRIMRPSL